MPYQGLNIRLLFWIPAENGIPRSLGDTDIAKSSAKALGKIFLGQESDPEKTISAGSMTPSPWRN